MEEEASVTIEPSSTVVSSGAGEKSTEEKAALITPNPETEPQKGIQWQGWLAGFGIVTLLVVIGSFLRRRRAGYMERDDR
jgi:hypothetical protein